MLPVLLLSGMTRHSHFLCVCLLPNLCFVTWQIGQCQWQWHASLVVVDTLSAVKQHKSWPG